jgi:hypothetical protein
MNVLKNTKSSLLTLQITAKCECPEKYKSFIVNLLNRNQLTMKILYFSGHSHLAVIQQVNNEDFVFFRTLTLGCDSEG